MIYMKIQPTFTFTFKILGNENGTVKIIEQFNSKTLIAIKMEDNDTPTSAVLDKQKEVKVRRIKAGYETYQVKKRHSVPIDVDLDKPRTAEKPLRSQPVNRIVSSSKNTARNFSRTSSVEGKPNRYRNTNNSSSNRNSFKKDKSADDHFQLRSSSAKDQILGVGNSSEQFGNDEVTYWEEESVSPKRHPEAQGFVNNKREKNRSTQVEVDKPRCYEEEIKRKVQGIAILECPCSYDADGKCLVTCNGCAEENHKTGEGSEEVKNCVDPIVDDKFLVASPADIKEDPLSERSVLDSELESDEAENILTDDDSAVRPDNSQLVGHFSKKISNDEINAMFTINSSKTNSQNNSKTNSVQCIDQVPVQNFRTALIESLQMEIDRSSSKSSLSRTSSSGESASSRRVSASGNDVFVTVVKHASEKRNNFKEAPIQNAESSSMNHADELEIGVKESLEANSFKQMNSILTILNQNKTLDTPHTNESKVKNPEVVRVHSGNGKDSREKSKNRKKEASKAESPGNKFEKHDTKQNDTSSFKNNSIKHRKSSSKNHSNKNASLSDTRVSNSPAKDNTHNNERSSVKGGLIALPNPQFTQGKNEDPDYNRDLATKQVRFLEADEKLLTPSKQADSANYEKQTVISYIKAIQQEQDKLKTLLQHGFQPADNLKAMIQTSELIQQKYGELIVSHQGYALKYDFENALWKSAFHNIITQIRNFLEDKHMSIAALQEVGKQYWDFLQNGVHFLDSINLQLQEKGNFVLEEYIDDPIKMASCSKQIKLSLRSCHLLLIFIGDLERYISQLQNEDNYSKAQENYKQAQMLAPKNGKSYNQLAVVSVITKHKLNAVYYYTRSLLASNPIQTARERLTAIFQEMKKKAAIFRKKYDLHTSSTSLTQGTYFAASNKELERTSRGNNQDHLRDEIWIFYRNNQMFKVMLTDQNEVIDLTLNNIAKTPIVEKNKNFILPEADKLTPRKVNQGFVVHFLFAHCKLYTNIGLEDFTSIHQEALSDLTTLLDYPKASSIKRDNLLKYIAVNIFMIHYLLEKQGHNNVLHGTALDFAIVFGMDMFAVLCQHCTKLISSKEDVYAINQFLPAIRIWLRWLVGHHQVLQKSSVISMLDVWSCCCDFFNAIKSLLSPEVETYKDGINVYAEEDLFLAGFKPLSGSLLYAAFAPRNIITGLHNLRINDTKSLILQLDECGSFPFACDESDDRHKPIQPTVVVSSPVKKTKTVHVEENDGDEEEEEDVVIEDDDDDEDYGDSSHVDDLKAQKALLTKQIEENEARRQAAMAVLESHRSEGRHLSENSPVYIVADTNCYIDQLQHIKSILDSKSFTLIVPLIVINELDGLKKGSYYDESRFHDHQRKVQEAARISVDFLEDRFSDRDSSIRALTSSGNEMTTIAFRAEEFSPDRGTNDDVILSCCLKYCKENIRRTEGDTNVVSRDVVLLTNDRNLRLKAHTRFVPTVDILTFMKMAKFL